MERFLTKKEASHIIGRLHLNLALWPYIEH